jgi:alpha-L-fucosidase
MTVPDPGTTVRISSMGSDAKLLGSPVKAVSLLGSPDTLNWRQKPDGLEITCPAQMPLKVSAVFRVTAQ